LETWDKKQVIVYRSVLVTTIQKNPRIGTLKPELSSKHRIFPARQHLIDYYQTESVVMISRILHKRIGYNQHLD